MAASLHLRMLGNRRVIAGARLVRTAIDRLGTTPAHREWRALDGDHTLRLEYDLTPESSVIDVGGYEGQWASDIAAMYGCRIEIYEPVPEYAERIERRFARNPRVTVHAAALGPEDGTVTLDLAGDATSHARAGRAGGQTVAVPQRDIGAVIDGLAGGHVDLMKVNIEGAEYDLLDHLVGSGAIERVGDLQVQFHVFVPNAEARLARLQTALARTHELTYQYDFLWENWRRRAGG